MSPLDQALAYAACGLPVFLCIPSGLRRKDPLTAHGFYDASCNPTVTARSWRRWPNALIGMPTGRDSGRNVLDIDVKYADKNGFDTLADLGWAILPITQMVHTGSGGLHLHFDAAGAEIRNTAGARGPRGIGPGLDWRGTGGYVILPSDGSGYRWDPYYGPDTPLASAPPNCCRASQKRRRAHRAQRRTGMHACRRKLFDRHPRRCRRHSSRLRP